MNKPWTTEQDDLLARMWGNGDTCQTIAASMSRSRNSIIGRVHRLGLPGRKSPIQSWRRPDSVNRIIEQAQAEAKAREANYADALSMSRTRTVGDRLADAEQRAARFAQAHMSEQRREFVESLRNPRTTCTYCGVRSDVGCKHQVAM